MAWMPPNMAVNTDVLWAGLRLSVVRWLYTLNDCFPEPSRTAWGDLAISRADFERRPCGMEHSFTAANRSSVAGRFC